MRRNEMNRTGFIKAVGAGAIGVAGAAMMGSNVAYAASAVVVGKGNPSDVGVVQKAVNAGGTVTLQGTFNFAKKNVVIRNNVVIQGQGATILNGIDSFLVNGAGISCTIEGIHFDGATGCAVNVHKCAVANIQANTINNVLMDDGFATGVWVNAENGVDLGQVNVLENAVSNVQPYEDGTNYFRDAAGIWIGQIPGNSPTSNVNIQGNTITNCGNSGVNVQGTPGAFVEVVENTITAMEYPTGVQDGATPNKFGLRLVSGGIATLYDGMYNPGPVYIANNTLNNISGLGMLLDCLQNSIVENNHINMVQPSASTYNLKYHTAFNICYGNIPNAVLGQPANSGVPGEDFDYTTDNIIRNNVISGKVKCGFRVSEGAKCNLFQANIFKNLELYIDPAFGPSGYMYYFTNGAINPVNDRSINNDVRGMVEYMGEYAVHEDSPGYNLINGVGDYYDDSECSV